MIHRLISVVPYFALAITSIAPANERSRTIVIEGSDTQWKVDGEPATEVVVRPGDTLVWKNTGGKQGVVFPSKMQAESVLTFEQGNGLPPLAQQKFDDHTAWGTSILNVKKSAKPVVMARARVRSDIHCSVQLSFACTNHDPKVRANLLVEVKGSLRVCDVVLENPMAQEVDIAEEAQALVSRFKVLASGDPTPSPDTFIAAFEQLQKDLKKCEEKVKNLESETKIIVGEDGDAYVTLQGDPTNNSSSLLKLLKGGVQQREVIAITRLHHPSLRMSAKWFDEENFSGRISGLHDKLRLKFAPFSLDKKFLIRGMRLRLVMKPDKGGPHEGFLVEIADNNFYILPDRDVDLTKVIPVPASDVLLVLPLTEDKQFQEAKDIAEPFRQPNARSIRIEWKPNSPPIGTGPFELTYRQKIPKWKMEYRLHVHDDVPQSKVIPWAFIYNRTAYEWKGITVTLRESGADRVEYRLTNVHLGSQQAGLFRVRSQGGDWTAEGVEELLRFDAEQRDSGKHPLHTIRIKEITGPYLVPGPVAIFDDGRLVAEYEDLKATMDFELRELKTVTVGFKPETLTEKPFEVQDIDVTELRYLKGASRKYAIQNKSGKNQVVRLKVLPLEDDWEFLEVGDHAVGRVDGSNEFDVSVKASETLEFELRRKYTKAEKIDLFEEDDLDKLSALRDVAQGADKTKLASLINIRTELHSIDEDLKLADSRIATLSRLAEDSVVFTENGAVGPRGIERRLIDLRNEKAALEAKRNLREYDLDLLLFGENPEVVATGVPLTSPASKKNGSVPYPVRD